MILVYLIFLLFGTLAGMLVLRLALWPAFLIIGIQREKGLRLVSTCFLMSFYWVGATITGGAIDEINLYSYLGWSVAEIVYGLAAQALFGVGGWMAGIAADRAAPLPHIKRNAAIAGFIVGTMFFAGRLADAFSLYELSQILGWLTLFSWFFLPIAAVYRSAFIQRKLISRFTNSNCVLCEYERVGRDVLCSECGANTRHLCYRCRRIVDARPGEPCPRCKATIAASCWKCGYDWTGLESDKCPECGVWKPVIRDSAEPAPADPA